MFCVMAAQIMFSVLSASVPDHIHLLFCNHLAKEEGVVALLISVTWLTGCVISLPRGAVCWSLT